MRNPRIYIVLATFHPCIGGVEKQALAQCKKIQERGFEGTIVTFRHNKRWPRQEKVENVPVLRVAGTLLGEREKLPRVAQRFLYLLALAVMGWTLWLWRRDYDVLHVHQYSMLLLPTALVCWLANKPMIIVSHNTGKGNVRQVPRTFSFIAGPLDPSLPWLQIEPQTKIGGDLANLQRLGKPLMYFTHSLLQYIHVVPIVISSRMKDYLKEFDFNFSGIQLIPNGIDITHFHPNYVLAFPHERASTVICVARLSYEKGIDVLLQAWHVVQQMPDLRARLIIVGGGPHEMQFKRMAQALGITDTIEFVGMQNDVISYLRRSSIAVLPSRWEGLPNVLLEAMACGLACVATRVSGSEDVIQHQVNGLLVEPEDYQGIAEALHMLLMNPTLVEEYAKKARSTIEKQYSLDYAADRYCKLYQRLTSPKLQITADVPSRTIANASVRRRW